MEDNWLESLNSDCDGYDIRDGPGFPMRAQDVINDIAEWDEIRGIHDRILNINPYIGEPIYTSDLWMRRIDYRQSILVLFYVIDEENCSVIYRDLRRFPA